MNNGWKELISSGILELYVLGETNPQENKMIEEMATAHEEVHEEIHAIELALENFAEANAVEPDPTVRPFLMSTIDFLDRMAKGETFTPAPLLNENSVASDYSEWLDREDMVVEEDLEDVYAKILDHSKGVITAIVWIKTMAPEEIHDREYERFLILEGTCSFYIGNEIFNLVPGDYLSVPLHKKHYLNVTSEKPCKAILQRVRA